jgi:glycerol kinase
MLVIDVGTSGMRAAVVRPGAGVVHRHHPLLPDSPAPGLVEFDARAMAEAVLDLGRAVAAEGGPVDAVGITNQRASTVVWDRATGEPVGPGIGWQDLRTVIDCLTLGAQGIRLAPNLAATKAAHLLDLADPDRTRDLCAGTVDSWVAWTLTGGAGARHRRHQRGPLRAAHRGPDSSGTPGARRLRIPTAAPARPWSTPSA